MAVKWNNVVATAYVVDQLRRRYPKLDEYGGKAEVARDLDIPSTQSIGQWISGARMISAESFESVASKWGFSYDTMLDAAIGWAKSKRSELLEPPRRETAIVYDERYPNRRKAIEFVQSSTRPVSKAAVDSVLSMSLQSADDPNTEWWLDELRAEDRRLSKLAGEPVVAPPVPSRPPLAERIAAEKKKRGK